MTARNFPVRRPRLSGWRRLAPLTAACVATVGLVATGGATAQPGGGSIESKKAEAQRVMAEIQAKDMERERVIAAYDDATYRLAQINRDLKSTTVELKSARQSLSRAQSTLQQRAVALYTNGQDDSTVNVILGATSLDDLMTRLDTAKRVSRQDAQTVDSVTTFRDAVRKHQAFLARKQIEQQQEVAKRAAARGTVERQLAERNAYLSHLNGEIRSLIEAQKAAQLAAAARAAEAARARIAANAAAATPAVATSDPAANTTGTISSGSSSTAPSGHGDALASAALSKQGAPYVWAASGPDTFDCSGLVMWAYAQLGISVPHSTYALVGLGQPVDRSDLQVGDMVFFDGNGHVGIYVGGGNFVHAPHTGTVVQVSSMSSGYYASAFDAARRY